MNTFPEPKARYASMSFEPDNDLNIVKGAAEGLRSVERFWQVELPQPFRNLFLHFSHPFLAPCEFFTLDAIGRGCGRGYGLVPQFMPFGRAVGEGGLYGFYITPDTALG